MNEVKQVDLIGRTGSLTASIEIIDATKNAFGTDIRVKDSQGDVYWTTLDEVTLD